MSNFQTRINNLVGKGAQKQSAERFARNVNKAYRREIDRAAEVVETLEDSIADIESLEGVNLKANTGLNVETANKYVNEMVDLRMKVEMATLRLNIAQRLYIEDFGKHMAPATSVEAVEEELKAAPARKAETKR